MRRHNEVSALEVFAEGIDPKKSTRSLELFANEIMPTFKSR